MTGASSGVDSSNGHKNLFFLTCWGNRFGIGGILGLSVHVSLPNSGKEASSPCALKTWNQFDIEMGRVQAFGALSRKVATGCSLRCNSFALSLASTGSDVERLQMRIQSDCMCPRGVPCHPKCESNTPISDPNLCPFHLCQCLLDLTLPWPLGSFRNHEFQRVLLVREMVLVAMIAKLQVLAKTSLFRHH